MSAISAQGVTKTYGDVVAVDDLTLAVDPGSTFGLLGTNGAGKTTLFKLLVGHVRPDAGRLEVAGRNVETAGTSVRRSVGYLPEHAGFPPSLTGREVLRFHARMRDLPRGARDDRIDEVLDRVGLRDAADRAVEGYSHGMNRRLGLATALLARPRILLLDEPTAGLDPIGVGEFHRVVRDLHADSSLTVVLSSHVLSEVERLCEEVAVLHGGRLLATGAVADLKADLDGGVTIHARLARPGDVEAAADAVRERGGTVAGHGGTLEIGCAHGEVSGMLDAVAGVADLDGFEVREPGLDRVFERTVGGEGGPNAEVPP